MEEPGYSCLLLKRSLPAKAPNSKTSQWLTEPIAVQQRVSNDTCKIIFWYLAQVDSLESPAFNTQQEGEDFEVCWVPVQVAALRMTYEEDQKVIDRVLDAMEQRALIMAPPTLTHWLQ